MATPKWDALNITIPWRHFIGYCLQNGELPLWYPYQFLGFGQYIDNQSWYWPTWILGAFGYTNLTFHLEFILHLMIGSWGFYTLLRYLKITSNTAILYSCIYIASGFYIGNAQHFGWIVSGIWIPIVLTQFLKYIKTLEWRYLITTSLSLYLLISGGYWGFTITTYYILIIIWTINFIKHKDKKKLFSRSLILIVLNIISSGVVLISIYDSINLIHRSNTNLISTTVGSFYPIDLLTLLNPISTYNTSDNFWKGDIALINIYIGYINVVLLIISFWKPVRSINKYKYLLGISLFFLILSMGETFPLRKFFTEYIPLFDYFRFPSLFRYFAISTLLIYLAVIYNNFECYVHLFKKAIIMSSITFTLAIFVLVAFNWGTIIKIEVIKPSQISRSILTIIQLSIFIIANLSIIILLKYYKPNSFVHYIFIAEIFITSQLMLPHTVVDRGISPLSIYDSIKLCDSVNNTNDKTLKELNKISHDLFKFGRNFSTYSKSVSYDGYTPYQYNEWLKLEESPMLDSIINRPLSYLEISDSEVNLIQSSPNFYKFEVYTDTVNVVHFSQNYHPGWTCKINNKLSKIKKDNISLMSVEIEPGRNTITFQFTRKIISYSFIISLISFLIQGILWITLINRCEK
ncbi:YfhO family protein [Carboxylicivirga caseinilyticus]|uniref:YfhO family protein n=1 Tax=Carboxylicivirga caseinilyticus TaxID=3417572 RepID=UPI003D352DFD|nr:YfhO family protein [Marinilabiliaceae bacterium A049]